ncbi:MAG: pilus assembly protein [Alphaproteobacteria bacterium]|nr:pilus assembly protein [Alphaproteobacteria bacterium]
MTKAAPAQALWRRRLHELTGDRRGVAAVEFALIAFPFFVLIFGLLEVVMIFILTSTLDYGVMEAARRLRTGELQTSGKGLTEFKAAVCGQLYNLLDCGDNLLIDVRTFNNFASTDFDKPAVDKDGNLKQDQFEFEPGGADQIVVVRAFYTWSLMTPVISAPLANMSGGRRLLVSTATFRNEPF